MFRRGTSVAEQLGTAEVVVPRPVAQVAQEVERLLAEGKPILLETYRRQMAVLLRQWGIEVGK